MALVLTKTNEGRKVSKGKRKDDLKEQEVRRLRKNTTLVSGLNSAAVRSRGKGGRGDSG